MQPCRSQADFKVRHFPYENILQRGVSVALQADLPLGGKGRTGGHVELSMSPGPEPRWAGPDPGTQPLGIKGEPFILWGCVNAPPHGVIKKLLQYNIILKFWKTGESSNMENPLSG